MIDESLLPQPDDVRFYRDNGYWISPWALPADLVARVNSHMDRVMDGHYETGRTPLSYWRQDTDGARALRKIDNAYWADNTIRELALHPAIGAAGAMLERLRPCGCARTSSLQTGRQRAGATWVATRTTSTGSAPIPRTC